MIKEIIAQGKDVSEAKENARAALGVSELDDVQFEVLHIGSRGIFGVIGVKPAQVKAWIEIPDREEKRYRGDKKDRKPKQDKPVASSQENTSSDVSSDEEQQDKPAGQKKNRNKKKSRTHEKSEDRREESSKPKSEVIPECELNFTLREVGEGEDMSFDFIKTVIDDIGLSATAALYSCDDGTRRITIAGDDASILIGHHGDTLDALQYLANLASARKNIHGERDKSRVTLDIEGYRAKREETLRALARKMAAKALRNRRSVMLEPMSAYERRIIHSEIQKIDGVSTNSVGSDNNRKIVIFLNDKKPNELFEDDKKVTETEDAVISSEDITEAIEELNAETPALEEV
jgi:spoIIIJ-associated protein